MRPVSLSHGVPLDLDVDLPVPGVDEVVLLVDASVVHHVHQVDVHVPQGLLKHKPAGVREGTDDDHRET